MQEQATFTGFRILLGCVLGLFGLLSAECARSAPQIIVPLPFNDLYLRCNSTDWQVSPRSHLMPEGRGRLVLEFEVKEKWMLDAGDACTLTESPQTDAWGRWQRTYTVNQPSLRVPGSAPIQIRSDAPAPTFRVVYPKLGTYRAVYHFQDAYLSIESKEAPQIGEVQWSLPGSLSLDAQQRLFLQTSYPAHKLMRIAPETGAPLWLHRASQVLTFQASCNDANRVLVLDQTSLQALDGDTGKELWHVDLRGEPQGGTAMLSCDGGSSVVLLIHGSDNAELSAFERQSGKRLWHYRGPRYLSVQGREGSLLYVSSYEGETSVLHGIDLRSGSRLWTRTLDETWINFDPAGALYVLSGNELQRVDARDGGRLWGLVRQSPWTYLNFEKGRTIVTEKDRLLRIDPLSGQTLWTWAFSPPFTTGEAYAQVLGSGEILVRTSESPSLLLVLDGASGRELWSRSSRSSGGFLTQARGDESFWISGPQLSAIDIHTGYESWRFDLPAPGQTLIGQVQAVGPALYASYGALQGQTPPMGVVGIARETGKFLWQNDQGEPLSLVGSRASLLYINVGTNGASGKAIRID